MVMGKQKFEIKYLAKVVEITPGKSFFNDRN